MQKSAIQSDCEHLTYYETAETSPNLQLISQDYKTLNLNSA